MTEQEQQAKAWIEGDIEHGRHVYNIPWKKWHTASRSIFSAAMETERTVYFFECENCGSVCKSLEQWQGLPLCAGCLLLQDLRIDEHVQGLAKTNEEGVDSH